MSLAHKPLRTAAQAVHATADATAPARPAPEVQTFAGRNLAGHDFSGADLDGADLSGATLLKANLRGASLARANLEGAELAGADLREAHLEGVNARNAGFGQADLRGAALFDATLEGATFSMANLTGADLRCANLRNGRMREALLDGSDLTSADLHGADLSGCTVTRAVFDDANLCHTRLAGVHGFSSARWIGTDIRDVNFSGAYRLRRFVVDQNYIHEFRNASRWTGFIYHLWWLTSDCGRSAARWCGCIVMLVLLFAWLFRIVSVDYGPHADGWLSAVYYSVVTLTTLGYGEIVPASPAGQAVVIAEVVSGYVMLGGLLSLFANKLARRGE